mmetsp:Transcript_26022/g.75893  ORF Transcript_26022/g.75893 Transcript_26022/m.75893 type:complete len:249 (-) Transcript_26022:667-1413(-)
MPPSNLPRADPRETGRDATRQGKLPKTLQISRFLHLPGGRRQRGRPPTATRPVGRFQEPPPPPLLHPRAPPPQPRREAMTTARWQPRSVEARPPSWPRGVVHLRLCSVLLVVAQSRPSWACLRRPSKPRRQRRTRRWGLRGARGLREHRSGGPSAGSCRTAPKVHPRAPSGEAEETPSGGGGVAVAPQCGRTCSTAPWCVGKRNNSSGGERACHGTVGPSRRSETRSTTPPLHRAHSGLLRLDVAPVP